LVKFPKRADKVYHTQTDAWTTTNTMSSAANCRHEHRKHTSSAVHKSAELHYDKRERASKQYQQEDFSMQYGKQPSLNIWPWWVTLNIY